MPPINPKPGDTYTNQMWQTFKYWLGSNGQMIWIQQPKQNQAVMTNPDLTMTRNEWKQVLITDPDWVQRWYDNDNALVRQRSYLEQQNKNKDAIINAYEKWIIWNNSNKEEPKKEETPKPTPKPKTNTNRWWSRTWNAWAVKQPEPTYVDQDWVTHTWMTQDEFNQSMQMYEADNQWWYEHQRNQVIWENWTTRWQIFDQAVEKFLANPDSFNDSQKQALIKVWQQLWYFNWSSATAPDQTETQTVTDTATTAPTVQPTVTSTPTQRQVNSVHDAYYAPQNSPWWITL